MKLIRFALGASGPRSAGKLLLSRRPPRPALQRFHGQLASRRRIGRLLAIDT